MSAPADVHAEVGRLIAAAATETGGQHRIDDNIGWVVLAGPQATPCVSREPCAQSRLAKSCFAASAPLRLSACALRNSSATSSSPSRSASLT